MILNNLRNPLPASPRAAQQSLHTDERFLILSLTSACGCNCAFCGLPSTKQHTFMEPYMLVAALEGNNTGISWQEINITGGDPLVVPKAHQLFSVLAAREKCFSRVSVCTAGIPYRSALKGLYELTEQISPVDLYVSLDGVGDLHDDIRSRKGAFAEVEQFLLKASKFVNNVILHCVINKMNVDALDEVADYSESIGLPINYGLVNCSDYYINNVSKINNVNIDIVQLSKVVDFFNRRVSHQCYDDILKVIVGDKRRFPCRLLNQGILVTSDGKIAICGTSQKMIIGKFKDAKSAREAWNRAVSKRGKLIAKDVTTICQNCCYIW